MLRRPRLLPGGVRLHVIQEETTGSLFFAEDDFRLYLEWLARYAGASYRLNR